MIYYSHELPAPNSYPWVDADHSGTPLPKKQNDRSLNCIPSTRRATGTRPSGVSRTGHRYYVRDPADAGSARHRGAATPGRSGYLPIRRASTRQPTLPPSLSEIHQIYENVTKTRPAWPQTSRTPHELSPARDPTINDLQEERNSGCSEAVARKVLRQGRHRSRGGGPKARRRQPHTQSSVSQELTLRKAPVTPVGGHSPRSPRVHFPSPMPLAVARRRGEGPLPPARRSPHPTPPVGEVCR